MRIAIVGSGISGMVAGYLLAREHEVTLFEANDYTGGHTCTVQVRENGSRYGIDTGFVVFNAENYPNFSRILEQLSVASRPTRMGFSVRCEASGLEYNGGSINGLFAQRRNLIRPAFYRMVRDILRFYREAPAIVRNGGSRLTLGELLEGHGYSSEFVRDHLIPMGSAVWSASPETMLDFPARYFVQFFSNHGFLKVAGRAGWRVVSGGSQRYVERLTAGYADRIRLNTPVASIRRHSSGVDLRPLRGEQERFDAVVLAVHSDQALRLLSDASERETEILSSMGYQENRVSLHTDGSLLPERPQARAGWNYHLGPERVSAPTITYYMNALQGLDCREDYCVSLNRDSRIDPSRLIRRMVYHHPIYTHESLLAQQRHEEINGSNRTYFCGAYWGYGFHEDGVNSALRVCSRFGLRL